MPFTTFLFSTVGKKFIIGISGLGICGFILTHVSANMLIIFNPEAYNQYSHSLVSNPFIYVVNGSPGRSISHTEAGREQKNNQYRRDRNRAPRRG